MRSLYKNALAAMALMSVNCYSAVYKDSQKWPDTTITYSYSTKSGEALSASDPEGIVLEAAVKHYEDNTAFRFVKVSLGGNLLFRKDPNVDGYSSANIGRNCEYFWPYPCFESKVSMESVHGVDVAVHELFHSLGFRHEQSRTDRLVEIAPGSSRNNDSNWADSSVWYNQAIGNFDFSSAMLYEGGWDVGSTLDDPRIILDILTRSVSFERKFRILVPDSTATNFDNMFLNNQTAASSLEVSNRPYDYHSPRWDFIYLGAGKFYIKNLWQNTYLYNDGSSIPILSSSGANSLKTWKVEAHSTGLKIYNDVTGTKKYLQHNLGSVSLSSNGSTSSSLWGIQIVKAFEPNKLSPMDKLAMNQVYGHLFRIQVSDGTPERTDNLSLNVQDYHGEDAVKASVLPLDSNLHNNWHSAMWHLERVGTYFRIKNLWDGEYIHLEEEVGHIEKDPEGTLNSHGDEIKTWHSAQWDLEINYSSGGFKVNNRHFGQYLKLNSNGTIGLTIDPDEAEVFDFAPVNWVDM